MRIKKNALLFKIWNASHYRKISYNRQEMGYSSTHLYKIEGDTDPNANGILPISVSGALQDSRKSLTTRFTIFGEVGETYVNQHRFPLQS
jgi:hypothetical protein